MDDIRFEIIDLTLQDSGPVNPVVHGVEGEPAFRFVMYLDVRVWLFDVFPIKGIIIRYHTHLYIQLREPLRRFRAADTAPPLI